MFTQGFILPILVAVVSGSAVFPLHYRSSNSSRKTAKKAVVPLFSTEFSSIVDVEMTFGGNQSFLLELDLGSSDTWVIGDNYECFDSSTNLLIPQSNCTYAANKTYTISDTFKQIEVNTRSSLINMSLLVQNEYFGVYYGAGTASGILGYETVEIGGILVPNQTIGVGYKSTNQGDGYISGLLGLSFPGITSAHPGTDVNISNFLFDRIPYSPLAFHMAELGLIDPIFSLAVERTAFANATGPGGYFGLGEVVPVPHKHRWARTPVVALPQLPVAFAQNKTAYWALDVRSVVWGPGSASSKDPTSSSAGTRTDLQRNETVFNAILDNGNPISYLPREISEAVNAKFSPPAVQTADVFPSWLVDCNATAPSFGIKIEHQIFWHDARDMIYNLGDGTCITSIASAEDVPLDGVVGRFLGLGFFKNVLAVFDFKDNEMRFAARD